MFPVLQLRAARTKNPLPDPDELSVGSIPRTESYVENSAEVLFAAVSRVSTQVSDWAGKQAGARTARLKDSIRVASP